MDIIDAASNYLSFNKIALTKLANVKYENDKYASRKELMLIEAELIKDIQYMLKQVDAMHF